MEDNFYKLPELKYGFMDLEPYISSEQLKVHYGKHHQGYVSNANEILKKLDKAREENSEIDIKAVLKDLSFNIGGHVLHSLFWENLCPASESGEEPEGLFLKMLNKEFGSFKRFKEEFVKTALTVEGSGWAALTFCKKTSRPLLTQIEKHNNNIYPSFEIILILDMFEHAYYIDHKNEKANYVENFWKITNWQEAEKRLLKITASG